MWNIFLNRIFQRNPNSIANFICLMAKQFVYSQKCLKGSLSIISFINSVNTVENSEKYYASIKNKLRKHYRKWYPTTSVMEMEKHNVIDISQFHK